MHQAKQIIYPPVGWIEFAGKLVPFTGQLELGGIPVSRLQVVCDAVEGLQFCIADIKLQKSENNKLGTSYPIYYYDLDNGIGPEKLDIPTIGIGSGKTCDGQIQVFHDILGLYGDFIPKHAKRFTNLGEQIKNSISQYKRAVESKKFPAVEHTVYSTHSSLKNN